MACRVLSDRRYHKQHKTQAVMDLERKKLDVVVTTYETCRDNIEELNRFRWTAIIADEVHKIKVIPSTVYSFRLQTEMNKEPILKIASIVKLMLKGVMLFIVILFFPESRFRGHCCIERIYM